MRKVIAPIGDPLVVLLIRRLFGKKSGKIDHKAFLRFMASGVDNDPDNTCDSDPELKAALTSYTFSAPEIESEARARVLDALGS